MKYTSSKTYGHEVGLSCAFRQWKAVSHCSNIHGYALAVKIDFSANSLDDSNWVIDFGGLKEIKDWLQATFDHKLLVATDDPYRADLEDLHKLGLANVVILPATGCEAFAEHIFWQARDWLIMHGAPRVRIDRVTVSEHGANSASYGQDL